MSAHAGIFTESYRQNSLERYSDTLIFQTEVAHGSCRLPIAQEVNKAKLPAAFSTGS
jgi:hypothetical protein